MNMHWTKEKPTQEGWYWHRENEYAPPQALHLRFTFDREKSGHELSVLSNSAGEYSRFSPLSMWGGSWSSFPIPMPEEKE